MGPLDALARGIDRLNDGVGRAVSWLTTGMVLLTAYDTIMRYGFQHGNIALQELEWHLFGIVFLIGAAYTLKEDGHVRVDIIYAKLDERKRAWINLIGSLIALIPFAILVIWCTKMFVMNSWAVRETSPDPGGLPARYALKAMIPLGFLLLLLQGVAEAIKNYRFLRENPAPGGGHGRKWAVTWILAGLGLLAFGFAVKASLEGWVEFPERFEPLIDVIHEVLPAIMFGVLFAVLLFGYPVAFTLGGTALFFGYVGFGFDFFNLLPLRIWGTVTNFTLLAVPLFVYMGVMLERSGLAEELLETMALLFGRMRGGLAISVVVVGALLAASTGIVGATVVTMGLLSLPTMLRRGYQTELATGVIAASGTLGQIIPPSIVLVLLGDIMNVPIGDLFIGSVIPGFILVVLYILWILIVGMLRPEWAPPIPAEERAQVQGWALARRVLVALIPPAFLMLAVLGSIFAGIASPTEAAALGAVGASILTAFKGRLNLQIVREVMQATTKLTCMVFIILVGAGSFGLVFRGMGGDDVVRAFIEWLPFGKWGILVIVMGIIFIAGFFLDFIEITFIHVPVLTPIMISMGVDPLWLAVLIAVNLQTSFLTPPFGFALFYLKGVAPKEVTTGHIYKGIIPFVVIQVIGLIIVAFWHDAVTWLPSLMLKQ
ncbi:TRAP transporter large permease subunit [Deferrisoma palaeochoriense]